MRINFEEAVFGVNMKVDKAFPTRIEMDVQLLHANPPDSIVLYQYFRKSITEGANKCTKILLFGFDM